MYRCAQIKETKSLFLLFSTNVGSDPRNVSWTPNSGRFVGIM